MASQPFPVSCSGAEPCEPRERLDISKAGTRDDGRIALPRQRPSCPPPAGSEGQMIIRISGMRQAESLPPSLTGPARWFLSRDAARELEMTTAFIFPVQGSQAVGM